MFEDCLAMLCLTVPDKKWVGIKLIKARKERPPFLAVHVLYYTKGKKIIQIAYDIITFGLS